MSAKILVVDDSLTIQKVVNITLANTGYSLTSAHDEAELFSKLEDSEFDLILLDFNLSENLTGYELVKKIKEKSIKSKILVMIGTFDNVNDSELEEAGIDESIIKPFESTKFTNLCKSLIDSVETTSKDDNADIFEDNGDEDEDWKVSTVSAENSLKIDTELDEDKKEDNLNKSKSVNKNSLKDEILGWGISLPDIIEAAEITRDIPTSEGIMPPQINTSDDIEFRVNISEEDDEDEYVDDETIDGAQVDKNDLLFPEVLDEDSTSSKLVSIDELKLEKDEVGLKVDDFIQDTELIEEINEGSDDFWAVDEDDQDDEIDEIEKSKVQVNEIGPKLEFVNDDTHSAIPIEEIVIRVKEELKDMISEIIEEKIKEVSSEVVERVAWEAIPDLAESLIQSEIKELSEKIQEKHT